MPYNLRKRTAKQEPVVAATPEKKPVVKRKTEAASAKKRPVSKKEPEVKTPAAGTKKRVAEVEPEQEKPKKKIAKKEAAEVVPEVAEVAEPKRRAAKKVVEPAKPKKKAAAKKEKVQVVDKAVEQDEEEAAIEKDEPVATEVAMEVDTSAKDRTQYSFGGDTCGELGLKKIGITRKSPTIVPLDKPVKSVVCGPMHTITLTNDGRVYTYGCNDEGALGRITDGDEELEATPTEVPLKDKVIKVTAGDSHSAVLTENNGVYIWGNFRDEHGSVGLTPECGGKATFETVQLMPGTKFQDIASGCNHMLLLDADGVVYSFGVAEQGQLGRIKPELLEKGVKITDENRELFLRPQKVSLKDVDPQRPFICDAVYAGNFSSFATNTDKKKNRLAAWGLNNCSQLGYKGQKGQLVQYFPRRSTFTCSTSMMQVACGQHHTLFLTKTGRLYSAGKHLYGMLGLGKADPKHEVICPAQFVEDLGNSVVDVSAGINTSFAVSKDGKLYAWGMGGTNLGLQAEDDLFKPTEVTSLAGKTVKSVSAGVSITSVVVE